MARASGRMQRCSLALFRQSCNSKRPSSGFQQHFNSAVVPFEGGFAGVFRCDDKNRRMTLHAGFSKDGFNWDINPETVKFEGADPEIGEWVYGYDPRVAKIEDKYYVTWCNGYHGPTIGVAWTTDFKTFHQLENAFLPYNRNGVLFPKKINGKFALLSRPSDTGHTAFGDIFYSESPDMEYWGHHRHVMAPAPFEVSAWQCMKSAQALFLSRPQKAGSFLSRSSPLLQRLCLCFRFSTPRPRAAMEGHRKKRSVPHLP